MTAVPKSKDMRVGQGADKSGQHQHHWQSPEGPCGVGVFTVLVTPTCLSFVKAA